MDSKIDPYDAIFTPEGADGTFVDTIDKIFKSGDCTGWLQIVVLLTKDKKVHILPQGYGIEKDVAEKAVKHAIEWQYAPDC